MPEYLVKSPVAFIIFNRPDTTERVFAEIARAQPRKLLVVADGPRADRPGEAEKCAAARAVIDRVDWDCEVLKNYSDTNLGCKKRVSSGLDWVFATVEEAIILEDDCLPHPSFFRFCDELLELYRDDERIMQVSGVNFLSSWHSIPESYLFSRYGGIWGWATWRSSWKHYDVTMAKWPAKRNEPNWLKSVCETKAEFRTRIISFDLVYRNGIDTWDYQWIFCKLLCNGISVIPSNNMIENIGFGSDATHTNHAVNELYMSSRQPMEFPLIHGGEVSRDTIYDLKYAREIFASESLLKLYAKTFIKNCLKVFGIRNEQFSHLRMMWQRHCNLSDTIK